MSDASVAVGDGTPPRVALLVSPGAGSHDGPTPTVFSGDSAGTQDLEQTAGSLSYSWDWDGDGSEDDVGPTSNHVYSAAGTYEVSLRVTDSSGLVGQKTFLVVVAPQSDVIVVTTATDESDPGATPAVPGGSGLSLREALAYAATLGGAPTVLVPAGTNIQLLDELGIASSVTVVADGARVDGSLTGAPDDCLQVDANDVRVFGLEIQNCRRSPLRVGFFSGLHFSRLHVHDNPEAVIFGSVSARFGPDNEVSRSASVGLTLNGPVRVDFNRFHDNPTRGIDLTGSADGSTIVGNVVTGSQHGMFMSSGFNNAVIVHNVLHQNTNGLLANSGLTGHRLQNNAFTENAQYGLSSDDTPFSARSHNLFFGNGLANCQSCSALGVGSLVAPPGYVDPISDDFRPRPDSPLLNAGTDTGEDVNGIAAGNFNGSNPDIGAFEAP